MTLSVRVTKDAQRRIRGGHPWIYDRAVTRTNRQGAPGDLAVLYDDRNRFLAVGLWDPTSPIRIRILQAGEPRPVDAGFWTERLDTALARRAPLAGDPATDAWRAVHGENDQLPGLVIDRYAGTWVVRLDTAAWIPHLPAALDALAALAAPERVVLRLSRTARSGTAALARAGTVPADGATLAGPPPSGPVRFRENGLELEADVVRGQKTGHFLDQRENRARVGRLAAGARVLDVFACTGGFALNAAAGGARSVEAVDLSPHAIATVERHWALNRHRPEVAACPLTGTVGDAFAVLADRAADRERYDLVIVDPPSFASKQADVERALGAYARLTRLALAVLAPGGVLVQSSCSSRVEAEVFFRTVAGAAAAAGRPLREQERTGHGIDHPVGFEHGAYLKTLFATAP